MMQNSALPFSTATSSSPKPILMTSIPPISESIRSYELPIETATLCPFRSSMPFTPDKSLALRPEQESSNKRAAISIKRSFLISYGFWGLFSFQSGQAMLPVAVSATDRPQRQVAAERTRQMYVSVSGHRPWSSQRPPHSL